MEEKLNDAREKSTKWCENYAALIQTYESVLHSAGTYQAWMNETQAKLAGSPSASFDVATVQDAVQQHSVSRKDV